MAFYLMLDYLLYFLIKNTCVLVLKNGNYNNTKKTETKRSRRSTLVHPKLCVRSLVPQIIFETTCTLLCQPFIIKGKQVNSGAGYGLEVPCEYRFEGENSSCNWLKEKQVKYQFNVQC